MLFGFDVICMRKKGALKQRFNMGTFSVSQCGNEIILDGVSIYTSKLYNISNNQTLTLPDV